MVLARTPDFQREFNRLLAERRVRKVYRAILDRRPPLGTLRHYLAPEGNLPRRASRSPAPGWEIAELSIHSAAELRFAHTDHVYFDAAIELHTGRLHQIRAQLAAAGCPIAGDKRYGSTVRFSRLKVGPGIGLFSAQIAWPRAEGSALRFTLDPPWGKQAESG
jgi:23S rRNA pseudouridine1911/1915/1917 synthase